MRNGEYTATELTKAYLDRLERIGPNLNAVVTVMRDRALETAAERDAELAAGNDRGPLHGIPYGAKDLLAAKGAPTTWGAAPYRNRVFDYDATVVNRLEEAGAVLVERSDGGVGRCVRLQSGGCVVHRADTEPVEHERVDLRVLQRAGCGRPGRIGRLRRRERNVGSIICPSSFSGVSGFRPTYGRVSRYGAMTLSYTMDELGPLCRSAHGCETVLRAIAGPDPKDDTAVERPLGDGLD